MHSHTNIKKCPNFRHIKMSRDVEWRVGGGVVRAAPDSAVQEATKESIFEILNIKKSCLF